MENENDNTQDMFGKFDSAKSLLDAYNALEAEFTKRCQLVKQLQAELDSAISAQAENNAPVDPAPSSADGLDITVIAAFIADDPELALEIAELPEICDACITRYKTRLLSRPIPSPDGAAIVAPVKRPRTLGEAKALADEILS